MTESFTRIIILFGSAMAAGGFVLLFPNVLKPHLKMLLAFSGAFLLGIAVLHILPEAYHIGGAEVGLFIIGGFLLQILLEYLSGGIEHGHVHMKAQTDDHHHKAISWTMLLSLVLHAITESMPLGFHGHDHAGHSHEGYLWAIVIHKIPITIALVSLMIAISVPRLKIMLYLFIFAVAAPIGILINPLFAHSGDQTPVFAAIMGLAGGIILHVSTTILLEASENHRFNLYKMVIIIIGFSLAFLSS